MMALILFFLKSWSILWTINVLGAFWVIQHKKPVELNVSFNLKTVFEWALYVTSIYSWFYAV